MGFYLDACSYRPHILCACNILCNCATFVTCLVTCVISMAVSGFLCYISSLVTNKSNGEINWFRGKA